MRDRLHMPIEYDQLRFGFYYSEPVANFPSIEVSQGRSSPCSSRARRWSNTAAPLFERALTTAFQKISEGLQDKVEFRWADIDSAVSFRGVGTSAADIDLFESLSKAVVDSREIEFEYKKAKSSAYESRRLRPYHLGCVSDQWYLFGFDLARDQIRTFVLQRMRGLRVTTARFSAAPPISPSASTSARASASSPAAAITPFG